MTLTLFKLLYFNKIQLLRNDYFPFKSFYVINVPKHVKM